MRKGYLVALFHKTGEEEIYKSIAHKADLVISIDELETRHSKEISRSACKDFLFDIDFTSLDGHQIQQRVLKTAISFFQEISLQNFG